MRLTNHWTRLLRGVVGALLIGAAVSCGGDDQGDAREVASQTPRPEPVTQTVSSWDEFMESDAAGEAGRNQVVFIGIDAGVWHFIDRMIDEGKLPNFARIKREGATGPLLSVRNYVTPPAWIALFTGYLPEKSGVYSFGYWDRETREFISSNSDDIEVPSVWEAASRAGLKVGVFNVPMTYPPRPVNGAMVTGQMTPIESFSSPGGVPASALASKYQSHFARPPASYSQPGLALVADPLNVFMATIYDGVDDGVQRLDSVVVRTMPRNPDPAAPLVPPSRAREARFALDEFSPWLRVRYDNEGTETDAYVRIKITVDGVQLNSELSPVVLPIDATFTYPPELGAELDEHFGFYLPTKFFPKELVPAVTRDAAEYASYLYDYDDWDLFCFVFTQTDNVQHVAGYSGLSEEVYEIIDRLVGDIMTRMPAGATLIIGSDHGSFEHTWGIDMNQLLRQMKLLEYSRPGKIDHDRTVVFHNLGHLYFNDDLLTREELAARGYDVPAGTAPREWLIDFMRRTNVRAPMRSFTIEAEPVPAGAVGHAPDMIVLGEYGDYTVDFWNIMHPRPTVVRKLEGNDKFWHSRDGVLLVWGEGVRRGLDTGVRNIADVAPTMLYLLGLPVAEDMDGRVMHDLFEWSRPVVVNRGYRDIPRDVVLPDDERETLQKKLRSLGYIQ